VAPGSEYEAVRRDVAAALLEIRDPETGGQVVQKVLMREEVYSGSACDAAPDFVAMPAEGYDLKGGFEKDVLLERGPVNGTHTFEDAMFYVNRRCEESSDLSVIDVMPTLLEEMGIEVPEALDGCPLVLR
jgi:predicted AlkP superfamily phosphohydrolase/phosphomutase